MTSWPTWVIIRDIILWLMAIGVFVWLLDWCFGGKELTEFEQTINQFDDTEGLK